MVASVEFKYMPAKESTDNTAKHLENVISGSNVLRLPSAGDTDASIKNAVDYKDSNGDVDHYRTVNVAKHYAKRSVKWVMTTAVGGTPTYADCGTIVRAYAVGWSNGA